MGKFFRLFAAFLPAIVLQSAEVSAARFSENPLITVLSSPSVGDNLNGPSIIRVPPWIKKPLGRYYIYFAHHKGQHIRLAYADSLRGPWKVYEPGVLNVSATAFFRPQPDPTNSLGYPYTHVASPEIYVDTADKKILMWVHGMWTEGQRWPEEPVEAQQWLQSHGYAQYTQSAESVDGLSFEMRRAITKQSYLRVFRRGDQFYGMARLGQMLRARILRRASSSARILFERALTPTASATSQCCRVRATLKSFFPPSEMLLKGSCARRFP